MDALPLIGGFAAGSAILACFAGDRAFLIGQVAAYGWSALAVWLTA